jgi:hypothetical protein
MPIDLRARPGAQGGQQHDPPNPARLRNVEDAVRAVPGNEEEQRLGSVEDGPQASGVGQVSLPVRHTSGDVGVGNPAGEGGHRLADGGQCCYQRPANIAGRSRHNNHE